MGTQEENPSEVRAKEKEGGQKVGGGGQEE